MTHDVNVCMMYDAIQESSGICASSTEDKISSFIAVVQLIVLVCMLVEVASFVFFQGICKIKLNGMPATCANKKKNNIFVIGFYTSAQHVAASRGCQMLRCYVTFNFYAIQHTMHTFPYVEKVHSSTDTRKQIQVLYFLVHAHRPFIKWPLNRIEHEPFCVFFLPELIPSRKDNFRFWSQDADIAKLDITRRHRRQSVIHASSTRLGD